VKAPARAHIFQEHRSQRLASAQEHSRPLLHHPRQRTVFTMLFILDVKRCVSNLFIFRTRYEQLEQVSAHFRRAARRRRRWAWAWVWA
ncbi:Protein of unknown function, partial [Gryllus bimaculatus]